MYSMEVKVCTYFEWPIENIVENKCNVNEMWATHKELQRTESLKLFRRSFSLSRTVDFQDALNVFLMLKNGYRMLAFGFSFFNWIPLIYFSGKTYILFLISHPFILSILPRIKLNFHKTNQMMTQTQEHFSNIEIQF